jgi:hypothetical protein
MAIIYIYILINYYEFHKIRKPKPLTSCDTNHFYSTKKPKARSYFSFCFLALKSYGGIKSQA